MVDKKFGKNVLLVILSNGVKLLSSLATIFLLPLIFTQQDYGFYKLFLLYISYVGFFHFGFIDGIYLFYGGKSYEELDKSKFSLYTKFLTATQLLISLGVFLYSFTLKGDRQIIMMLVSANVMVLNLTSYYQFISQITGRFKEFAIRNILLTIFNLTLIFTFLFTGINNYLLFILLTLIINIILLLWYVFTYKDITFTKRVKFKIGLSNIKLMYKLGIPLLLSNIVVMVMSNLPNQFIEKIYPIEKFPEIFSNFSFSFTLLGFTGVFLTAISLVLYPTLKKSDYKSLSESYDNFDNLIIVTIFLSIIAYYPLKVFINRFLPNYHDSLIIFFILCPSISLTSSISVIKSNYFKSINKINVFLIVGIIMVIFQIITIGLIYIYNKNIILLTTVSFILIQLLFFVITDIILQKKFSIFKYKKYIYIFVASLLFYSSNLMKNNIYSLGYYLLTIMLLTVIMYYKEIKFIKKKYKKGI